MGFYVVGEAKAAWSLMWSEPYGIGKEKSRITWRVFAEAHVKKRIIRFEDTSSSYISRRQAHPLPRVSRERSGRLTRS